MAKHKKHNPWPSRVAAIGAIALTAPFLAAGLAVADTISLDGDTATTGGSPASFTLADGNCEETVAGTVTVKYSGGANSTHFTPGEPVQVNFFAPDDSGIVVELDESEPAIPQNWNGNEDDVTFPFTTSIGQNTGDANYQVGVSVVGANYAVGRDEGNGRPQFAVSVDCVADGGEITNNAPSVSLAANDASGNEGSTLQANGAFADADTADTLTITKLSGDGTIVNSANRGEWSWSLSTTDNGSGTVVVSVSDGQGGSVTDAFDWQAVNVAPVIGAIIVTQSSACEVQLSAAFSDAGSGDTHDAGIMWGDEASGTSVQQVSDASPVSGSHTYTASGDYTASVTVTDDDGGTDTDSVATKAYNTPSAFLAPINTSGTRSSFKIGSTIPVKITVTGCDKQPATGLSPVVNLVQGDTTADVPVNEQAISEIPTNGKSMRWDGAQYTYNLSTKASQFSATSSPLTTGTYTVSVNDPSFQRSANIKAMFDARK